MQNWDKCPFEKSPPSRYLLQFAWRHERHRVACFASNLGKMRTVRCNQIGMVIAVVLDDFNMAFRDNILIKYMKIKYIRTFIMEISIFRGTILIFMLLQNNYFRFIKIVFIIKKCIWIVRNSDIFYSPVLKTVLSTEQEIEMWLNALKCLVVFNHFEH